MKVAIIMDGLAMGGAERQAVLAAAELVRRGVQAELIHYNPVNEYQEFAAAQGARVVGIFDRGPLRLGRVRALARHFRQHRFDVVHAFNGNASVWGVLSAALAGVPCVLGGYRGQEIPRPLSRLALKLITRHADGMIVNAECLRTFLARRLGFDPARVFVVPNGIHADTCQSRLTRSQARARLGVADSAAVVIMVANLRPEKNHPMFLRMAGLVGRTRPDSVFLAVGGGPLLADMESLARQLGVQDRVRFLGRRGDVPDLLAASDVATLTSVTEGLPNTIAEAGGAGLPCVSTDNGGASEVLLDGVTGYIVPQDDPQAMARRVIELLDDPQARRQMGEQARRHVLEHLSPEAMGRNLLDVYGRCLRGKMPAGSTAGESRGVSSGQEGKGPR